MSMWFCMQVVIGVEFGGREGWGFSMHPMGCEETQRL